jgi:hypothetical protein
VTISFVGSSGVGVDTGNPVLVLPTGLSLGDAVLAVGICNSSQTLTAPAGWSVRSGWPKDGSNARFYAWTKDSVVPSDSGASATFTSSAANKVVILCAAYHSGNGFPSDWTDALTFQAHTTTSTTYTAPSSTSTASGDWGVAVFGVRGANPTAWTPVVGTERQDLQRTGSGATALQLVDSNGSIGGSGTTWGPWSETNISSSNGGALTWLIKENASGGGGGGGGGGGTLYPKLGLWRERGGSWRSDMDSGEAVYGKFQGHWSQYHAQGDYPLSSAEITALGDGKALHVFWKPPHTTSQTWAQVAAGANDTNVDAVANSIKAQAPKQIWLTLWHEPDDDIGTAGAGTAADYVAMWQHVRARFDALAVTNVTWVMVYQNSHSHPEVMASLWPGDAYVDITSQQDYIVAGTTPSQLATKWLEDLEYLVSNTAAGRNWSYLSRPQAFTEWGADLGGVRGTNSHRAQTIDAIRGILPDLASRNVVEIRYFDARSDVIDDPPSVDGLAFQALKDATESGQSTGPIAAAGVALARDASTTTSNTIPFTLPSGWQPGDYATVWLSSNSQPNISVVPAGWALAEGPVNNSTTQRGWRYRKFLAAGEPNPTWTIDQSVRPSGVMVLLRGVDGTVPIVASSALTATSSGTSHAAPAVTVPDVYLDTYSDTYVDVDAVIVTAWLFRWADASGNGGSNYGTPPGTHTTLGSVSPNSGANAAAGALVAELTASPVGPGSFGPYTATVPVTSTGICGQLAILPGAPAEPTPTTVFGTASLTVAFTATAVGVTIPAVAPVVRVPQTSVKVAWASQPMDPAPVWTDLPMTGANAVRTPITITHGRGDEFSEVQPGTASADLRNESGNYTLGKTTGLYGANVKPGKRVRVEHNYQGVIYPRHTGHANSWPTTWPTGRGTFALGGLSSTDRFKRLGNLRKLRSMLEEEVLRDAPAVYFPLSESEGAASAGSITPTPQQSATPLAVGPGGGGTVTFGQGTGPGTDGLPAAVFAPRSPTSGLLLRATPVTVNASAGFTLACWFATESAPTPNPAAMAAATTPAGDDAVLLGIGAGGKVQATVVADGLHAYSNTSPVAYNDGGTHVAHLTLTPSGGVVTVRLYVDGVLRQSGTYTRGALGVLSQVDLGGYHVSGDWAPYAGTLSHVAAFTTALSATRIATHYQAGATGLQGERTDQRIARVADWIGLPAGDRALDVGDKLMGPQSTSGKQPLEVMQEAAQVEQGVLFISPAGKLTFHRLSRRYNRTTPDLTLDCAAGHVQVGLELPGDDFGLTNDLEVSRPGGATQRAFNQASINEYGVYDDSLEIPAYSDSDAQAVGNWRVGNYGTPRVRVPNLTVSLARLHDQSPALVQTILGLEISSLIRLVNLPTQAPGTSVDVYLEGWTETIDPGGTWAITLNCSPADFYTVARVGTAKVGQSKVAL